MTSVMTAVALRDFGGPEMFESRTLPTPVPGPGHVLVRVRATSVNPIDMKLRNDGRWAGLIPPTILGFDLSGEVAAVGPGVTNFRIGDEVWGSPHIGSPEGGAYAQYVAVPADILGLKPPSLTHEEAASLPLATTTAWDALIEQAGLRLGEEALIHGGGGGVGTAAIQLARAAGAYVLTTCGDYDAALCRSLGADETIDYRTQDFVEVVRRRNGGAGMPVIFDTVGGATFFRSLAALAPGGRLASIVAGSGDLAPGYRKNARLFFTFRASAGWKMDVFSSLAERGLLRPVIGATLSLSEVADAHRLLAAGGPSLHGKIVLTVA